MTDASFEITSYIGYTDRPEDAAKPPGETITVSVPLHIGMSGYKQYYDIWCKRPEGQKNQEPLRSLFTSFAFLAKFDTPEAPFLLRITGDMPIRDHIAPGAENVIWLTDHSSESQIIQQARKLRIARDQIIIREATLPITLCP
jgi:hypothetical protein